MHPPTRIVECVTCGCQIFGSNDGALSSVGETVHLCDTMVSSERTRGASRAPFKRAMASPRSPKSIVIRGARTHNLKNLDVTIPTGKLVVLTGVSGSGKSSLAFDTIYAEGQRRYVESLSAYARQFLERMEKPDVDRIEGIAPAVAIRQKNSVRNPRSTVGTVTEIHDYMRLLFARVGRTYCTSCGSEVIRETAEVVTDRLLGLADGGRILIGFDMPVVSAPPRPTDAGDDDGDDARVTGSRAETRSAGATAIETLRRKGFGRLLVGGAATAFEDVTAAMLAGSPVLSVVVDRLRVSAGERSRLTDSIEIAYLEGGGSAWVVHLGEDGGPSTTHVFSERFDCRACGLAYEDPQPRLFSFNNPFGACAACHGFGNVIELDLGLVVPDPGKSIADGAVEPWTKPHYRSYLADLKKVAKTLGVPLDVPWAELSAEQRALVVDGDGKAWTGIRGFFAWLERKKYKVHVRVFLSRYRGYQTCPDCAGTRLRREARAVRVGDLTIDRVSALTTSQAQAFFDGLSLAPQQAAVAEKILSEIRRRLGFLSDVGLDYLTLDHLSSTLSGGESQRINLATSLGASLVGTLYVLDEPSIGLHPRDNQRLIAILRQLRDQGNSVLVVEHDADMIAVADHVVDMGLGAGEHGGRVIFSGPLADLPAEPHSLTAKYLRGELHIPVPPTRRKGSAHRLKLVGAREHNLKDVDIEIPFNALTCVTGVSGSGKSTLVHDVLYAALKRAKGDWDRPVGLHRRLEGAELVSDVVLVDQTPIGRTPRSNPVTYLKAFDPIRDLLAATKDARAKGFSPSHFSFNVPGGRCEACQGEGEVKVEMQFLADVFVPCEHCDGKRFKAAVLDVRYKGKNVTDILGLTVREALHFFQGSLKVLRRLQVLDEVGLGYIRLGQPATTLSGGEAQRVKIASHLVSAGGDRMLYVLDEPTTGLHFDDIAKLLGAFRRLLDAGSTLLVIEHNLDVIKTADWVIDLGPDGGEGGGRLVAMGTPEHVTGVAASHTGRFLKTVLGPEPHA